MPDMMSLLGYQQLTNTVQQFVFPEFWFVNQVQDEPVDGAIASWDIEKPIIEIDYDFTTPSGEAQAVRSGDYGSRSSRMPCTFKFVACDPNKLAQLRAPGTTRRSVAGRDYITREQASLERRFGQYLEEYMISQALTGSLTIKVNGVTTVIDYGVPSSHKPTAAVSWAQSGTNILPELTEWKRLIRKDTGKTPRWAICGQNVMNYLMTNDFVKNMMGQTSMGIQIAENGMISRFHGLNWVVVDHYYASPGATEQFDTPFLGADKLLNACKLSLRVREI